MRVDVYVNVGNEFTWKQFWFYGTEYAVAQWETIIPKMIEEAAGDSLSIKSNETCVFLYRRNFRQRWLHVDPSSSFQVG